MNIRADLGSDRSIHRDIIPSSNQLDNYLAYSKRKNEKRPMSIIEDVNAFIRSKLIEANSEEFNVREDDDYFVVDQTDFESKDDKGEVCSGVRFTITTKDMLSNLDNAIKNNSNNGLVLTNDGTYSLIIGDWVVIICGHTVVIFEKDGSSHLSYRPILIQITMVEQTTAFVGLFKTLIEVADVFLGVKDLRVEKMIIDHSASASNAVKEVLKKENGEPTDMKQVLTIMIMSIVIGK